MQTLLGRDLTPDEKTVRASLRAVVRQSERIRARRLSIRDIATSAPEHFFIAALSLLDSITDPVTRFETFGHLLECPEFLQQLTDPDRFTRTQLLEVCRGLMAIDSRLDVHLARLMPGRQEETRGLDPEVVVRVLDLLNELSPGPRLIMTLNHLTRHSDRCIAAKATYLLGSRVRNSTWLEAHLNSRDPRVRASVAEALWGIDTIPARRTLWACLKDENNRVVGNALVGLHLLGERKVDQLLVHMLRDPRPPFRWTAAWVMGKIGNQEFVEHLLRAVADPEQGVRQAARRALLTIRKTEVARQKEEAARAAAEAAAAAAQAEASVAAAATASSEDAPAETVSVEVPAPAPVEQESPAVPKAPEEPSETPEEEISDEDFDLHLDGRYISSRN